MIKLVNLILFVSIVTTSYTQNVLDCLEDMENLIPLIEDLHLNDTNITSNQISIEYLNLIEQMVYNASIQCDQEDFYEQGLNISQSISNETYNSSQEYNSTFVQLQNVTNILMNQTTNFTEFIGALGNFFLLLPQVITELNFN